VGPGLEQLFLGRVGQLLAALRQHLARARIGHVERQDLLVADSRMAVGRSSSLRSIVV